MHELRGKKTTQDEMRAKDNIHKEGTLVQEDTFPVGNF